MRSGNTPILVQTIRLSAVLLFLLLSAVANASIAYKCTDAKGGVVYQDAPCPATKHQQAIDLPAGDVAAAALPVTAESTAQAPTPYVPHPFPSAPLPMLYRCLRATDGTTYLSSNGNPAPYYAPLGIVGLPSSLSQTYGAANLQANVRPNAAMIASHYTQVQDACQALSPAETCRALRDEYDDNELKLSRAFQSQQAPLLQRESDLRAQLTHC